MKPTLIAFLLLTAIFCHFRANAQQPDSVEVNETFFVRKDLGKGQIKWLNQYGFETEGYEWNDPAIKMNVRKALRRRDLSTMMGIVGGGAIVMGAIYNLFLGPLAHSVGDTGGTFKGSNASYYIGGAMVVTSITLSFNSLSKLNKAKKAREKKFK